MAIRTPPLASPASTPSTPSPPPPQRRHQKSRRSPRGSPDGCSTELGTWLPAVSDQNWLLPPALPGYLVDDCGMLWVLCADAQDGWHDPNLSAADAKGPWRPRANLEPSSAHGAGAPEGGGDARESIDRLVSTVLDLLTSGSSEPKAGSDGSGSTSCSSGTGIEASPRPLCLAPFLCPALVCARQEGARWAPLPEEPPQWRRRARRSRRGGTKPANSRARHKDAASDATAIGEVGGACGTGPEPVKAVQVECFATLEDSVRAAVQHLRACDPGDSGAVEVAVAKAAAALWPEISKEVPISYGPPKSAQKTEEVALMLRLSISDEAWQLSAQKRFRDVTHWKSTSQYQNYSLAVPHDMRKDGDPGTPNPMDRFPSKRAWKAQVEDWHCSLKLWQPVVKPVPIGELELSGGFD